MEQLGKKNAFSLSFQKIRKNTFDKISEAVIVLSIIYLIINSIVFDVSRLFIGAINLSILLFLRLLNRRGKDKLASVILLVFLWSLYSIVYILGPINSIFLASFVIVFIYALMLFGFNLLFYFVSISIVVILSNYFIIRPVFNPPLIFDYNASYALFLVFIMTLMTLYPLYYWYKELEKEINLKVEINQEKEIQRIKYEHIFRKSPVGYFEIYFVNFYEFMSNIGTNEKILNFIIDTKNHPGLIELLGLRDMNTKAMEILGYDSIEQVKSNVSNIFQVSDFTVLREVALDLIEGKKNLTVIIDILSKDKKMKNLLVNIKISKYSRKERVFGIVAFEDISHIRKIELDLTRSLHDKSVLLKELDHRVRNYLQTIISFIDMMDTKNYTRENILRVVKERIMTMIHVYSNVYGERENQTEINIKNYLDDLIFSTSQLNRNSNISVEIKTRIVNHNIKTECAAPLGLAISELLSNSLKHAFNENGVIEIECKPNSEYMIYQISDNGKGFDLYNKNVGFGLALIELLVNQINGKLEIVSDKGTSVRISISLEKITQLSDQIN